MAIGEYCSVCGEFLVYSIHTCKPCWLVWDNETCGASEAVESPKRHRIFASDSEDAAIAYALSDWEHPDKMQVHVLSWKIALDTINENEHILADGDKLDNGLADMAIVHDLESEVIRNFVVVKRKSVGQEK